MAGEEQKDSEPDQARQPRIVVGVDGSTISFGALDWAAREASMRGATLEIVHVTLLSQDAMELDALAALKKRGLAILDEAVARASALAPSIIVVARVADPPASEALVDVSGDADLLVVGSRGLGLFKEFALGSVSQDCARQAQCPLVIIGPRTVQPGLHGDASARGASCLTTPTTMAGRTGVSGSS